MTMMFPSCCPAPGLGFVGVAQAVQSAIAYDESLDGSCFTVTESSGVLYLDGSAPSHDAVERALRIAHSVSACRIVNRVLPVDPMFALVKSWGSRQRD